MRFRSLVSLTSLAGALFVTLAAEQAQPPAKPDQATALFDGKSLSGWRGYKKPDAAGSRWTVQDGMLTLPANDGKDTRGARDIISADTFDLFDLSWEWRIARGRQQRSEVFRPRGPGQRHRPRVPDDRRRPAPRRQDRAASADGGVL